MSTTPDPFDFPAYAERTVGAMASVPGDLFNIDRMMQRWGKELIASGVRPTVTADGPVLDPADIEKGQGERWERACRVLRALHQIKHAITIGRVDLALAVAFKVPECNMLLMSREMALALPGFVPDDMRDEKTIEVHMDGEDQRGVGLSPDYARGIRDRFQRRKGRKTGLGQGRKTGSTDAEIAAAFELSHDKSHTKGREREVGWHYAKAVELGRLKKKNGQAMTPDAVRMRLSKMKNRPPK